MMTDMWIADIHYVDGRMFHTGASFLNPKIIQDKIDILRITAELLDHKFRATETVGGAEFRQTVYIYRKDSNDLVGMLHFKYFPFDDNSRKFYLLKGIVKYNFNETVDGVNFIPDETEINLLPDILAEIQKLIDLL